MQPSPPPIFRIFSSSPTETLSPFNANSAFLPPPSLSTHHAAFWLWIQLVSYFLSSVRSSLIPLPLFFLTVYLWKPHRVFAAWVLLLALLLCYLTHSYFLHFLKLTLGAVFRFNLGNDITIVGCVFYQDSPKVCSISLGTSITICDHFLGLFCKYFLRSVASPPNDRSSVAETGQWGCAAQESWCWPLFALRVK